MGMEMQALVSTWILKFDEQPICVFSNGIIVFLPSKSGSDTFVSDITIS